MPTKRQSDRRGSFVKIFEANIFRSNAISFQCNEIYFSCSNADTLRGMHFQSPPFDHHKLVSCISGLALDVVLDLRVGSPTFGRYESFQLSESENKALLIPSGLAHGFLSLRNSTCLLYLVTSPHTPSHDSGIRWDSFGYSWPGKNFIMSDRDKNMQPFEGFKSPFVFKKPPNE